MGDLNLSSRLPKRAALSITLNLEAVCRVGLQEHSYLLDGTVASSKSLATPRKRRGEVGKRKQKASCDDGKNIGKKI